MKIAAYCRVSTDRCDQHNSYTAQIRYFDEITKRNPEWELYCIYADEGISGTSTAKRAEFNRMISDAYVGRYDLIVTKEVSRFSRNILDTIIYTRELKTLGIGVLFLTDGINTLDADAELRLSIMGSIAQEESRKTSARVKWGQTRQMERGVVFGRSLLGYDVRDGKMTVEPIGAELVRAVFFKYTVERKGTSEVAREMAEMASDAEISRRWTAGYVTKILKNEKYVGDLLQKKTYTADYLTHRKKYNRGEEEQIYIKDHHEPIIDRETWESAQAILRHRGKHNNGTSSSVRYALSGRIKCGICGGSFVSRNRSGAEGKYKTWACFGSLGRGGEKCGVGVSVRDTEVREMVREAITRAVTDRDEITRLIVSSCCGSKREEVREEAKKLLSGESESDALIRRATERITVYPDKRCEVRLCGCGTVWTFIRTDGVK